MPTDGVGSKPTIPQDLGAQAAQEVISQVVDKAAEKIKAELRSNLSFGAGKADKNTTTAEAMGLVKAVITRTGSDWAAMMMSLRSKSENSLLKASSETVKKIKDEKATQAQERLDKLEEMLEKIEKAAKKATLGKIFGWIAAGAMMLAGALLMVAGGAGAALMIAGGAMMAAMVLQETGAMDAIMEGLTDLGKMMGMSDQDAAIFATAVVGTIAVGLAVAASVVGGPAAGFAVASSLLSMLATPENLQAMAPGLSDEDAAKWSMGITIGLAVLGIAAGAGSAAGSSGAVARAAANGSKMAGLLKGFAGAGKAMRLSAALAQRVPQTMQAAARLMSYVVQGLGALSTVAGGGAGIHGAVLTNQANQSEADAKELEAFLAKLQGKFDEETERIQEIMNRMEELASTVMSIMKGDNATFQKALQV